MRLMVHLSFSRLFWAGLGGTPVGSTSGTGTVPPGFTFPEGSVSFPAETFDAVRITSTAIDFAVDNINVEADTVMPEPGSIALTLSGLAGVVAVSRRHRRA